VRAKTLTPPLPLPYRGGESIARGQIVYNYLFLYSVFFKCIKNGEDRMQQSASEPETIEAA